MKKNIKIYLFSLIFLFLIALYGLFVEIDEFGNKYIINRKLVRNMSKDLIDMRAEIQENKKKIENFNFAKFKADALATRYPKFSEIIDTVYLKSKVYDFDPNLVLGMIQVESAFNPEAVSHRGAYGLMQVTLAVWKDELSIDENKIFDVEYNIDLGLKILKRYYLSVNGDLKRALHLYNNGYKYNNTSYAVKVIGSRFLSAPKLLSFSN